MYICQGFRMLRLKRRVSQGLMRLAVRSPGVFQGGRSDKAAHANALSLCSLCNFLLLLFGVVRGDCLSHDSGQLTFEASRLVFHTSHRSIIQAPHDFQESA